MRQLISVSAIAIFLAVSAFTFSTVSMMTSSAQAKSFAWAKVGFGAELYGLPHVMTFHKQKFAKLNYGDDMYGLPNIADNRMDMAYAKIDYGQDMYGLPNIADNRSTTWARIGYGDELYGLPDISGEFKG